MKKITSLVFILPLFVLITCKNTVSDEVIKNKLLNSIETLGKEFSDAFISSPFGGSLGTAAIDLICNFCIFMSLRFFEIIRVYRFSSSFIFMYFLFL